MKFINIKTNESADSVLEYLKNNDKVNEGVRFEDKKGGKPFMHIKEKDGKLRVRCEMVGRPTKDNGFLMGTQLYGSIREKDGETTLKGVILTSPVYHIIVSVLAVVLIVQGIVNQSLGVIPALVFAVAFEFMFFVDEFKKQGYIERYILRAIRRLEKKR